MTNPAATTGGVGPFETAFQTGAAVVSVLSVLVGLLIFWTGYQGSELLVVGTELDMISGAAGFMFLSFFALLSLVAAIYMEPGFDH